MTRPLPIVAVCLWLAGVPGTVQQQDRQAPRQAAGSVRGRVVAADSGRPVAHATITVAKIDLPQGRASVQAGNTVVADEQGGFSFIDLPSGSYELTASKPGTFLDTQYGQIDVDLPGSAVIVRGGQETTLELRLMKAGVITGRVLDVNGEPVALADVALAGRDSDQRSAPGVARSVSTRVTGQRTSRVVRTLPASASQTQSNDLGEFRFFGLPPDEYILSATLPPVGSDPRGLAVFYFPGASDPSQATRIKLGPGQQITGADFSIRSVPTVTISGIVVGPDGTPVPSGTLSLVAAGLEDVMSIAQIGSVTNGAFSFDAAPGTYVLRGSQPSNRQTSPYDLSGSTHLAVGEQGLQGVTLTLGYGATVKGRVVVHGSSTSGKGQIRISVESGAFGQVRTGLMDQTPAGSRSVSVAADASEFSITGIESGAGRITAQGPPELILKGVFVGGDDVTDQPIPIAEGATISDVSVEFAKAKSVLIATVSSAPAEGGAVIVFPERPDWWTRSSRIKVAPMGTAPITFDSLPAGPYLVVALAGVSARSLQPTPRLLTALALNGVRVELLEGQTTPVNVQAMQLR